MKNFFIKLVCSFICFGLTTVDALTPKEVDYFPQTEEVSIYLNAMPWDLYKSYFVKNLGWFWVDSAKDCVKDEIKAGRIWEPYIIQVFSKYISPGDTVVDIGAHMGTITMALSNLVGPKGKVYSFEGHRQFFRELVHNLYSNQKKNVFPHLCWVGDEIGTVTCNGGFGKTYSPVWEPGEWELPKRTLDSFHLENVALIKIDVECTEDFVLAGAYNTIMESRPVIVIEIMGGYGHDRRPEIRKRIKHTISLLNKMDYDVSLIHIDDYLALPRERALLRK